MIDLREFYLSRIDTDDYYYRFYELIKNVNMTYNIFSGYEETSSYEFVIYDAIEAIEKFRALCQPGNEPTRTEDKCWFFLVSYYLDKNNYLDHL